MSQSPLFEEPVGEPAPREPARPGEVRVSRPVRNQVQMIVEALDSRLRADHPARAVWALIEQLDLSAFYGGIRAAVDGPGRPPTDPPVLLALWVYATVQGVGSARQLDRLCKEHDAYRWLCGGVPINYHMLSDFRVVHQQALDDLLTQIVAVLMHRLLVKLERVGQDGVKIRASAGGSSFRRERSLTACHEEARARVAALAQQREHPDPGANRREQAARERAAREREQRVAAALRELPAVRAIKERQAYRRGKARAKVTEARVSTTDPEARVMRIADGGFRPAFNVQVATDIESQVIVGVAVNNQGTDQGQARPLEGQVVRRTGRHPGAYLLDEGYVDLEDISALEAAKVAVYMPPKSQRSSAPGPGKRLRRQMNKDGGLRAWWDRMQTPAGQAVFGARPQIEAVNGAVTWRYGLRQFPVRGQGKVLSVLLLIAVAHNLTRWMAMG